VNFREGWRGHLWQGRFASCPLGETYLVVARYLEQNPVRAGLAATPGDYPWSSATAHAAGKGDSLVKASPVLELVGNWKDLRSIGASEDEVRQLRRHERTGRSLDSEDSSWPLRGSYTGRSGAESQAPNRPGIHR
jgi:putative transposase